MKQSKPNQFADAFHAGRQNIVNALWVIHGIIGVIVLLFSVVKTFDEGWTPAILYHQAAALVAIAIAVLRNKIPHKFKTGFIILVWLAVGGMSLCYFGLVGVGNVMFIGACFLTFALIGPRTGITITIISLFTLTTFGYFVVEGMHSPPTNAQTYALSSEAWAIATVVFLLIVPTLGAVLAIMNKQISIAVADILKDDEKYREIFNASSEAIFIHHAQTGHVLDVNDVMLEMYRCTREDIIGKPVDKFSSGIPPFTTENATRKIKKAMFTGPQTFEWQARRLDDELFWVEVTLRYSRIGGNAKVIAVARDITERKRADEILVQNEKMLSVGGLAAGIAHELNNPLSGMMQNAQLLQQRFGNLNTPASKRALTKFGIAEETMNDFLTERALLKGLDRIRTTGQRASDIITNMLRFARSSEGVFTQENIPALVDQTLELARSDYNLKKKYDFKQIKVNRNYQESLPSVHCNPVQIQQVVLNILRNGAEAMFEKGPTFLHNDAAFTLRICSNPNPEVDSIFIEIEDNGPGMKESVRKRILEPFFTTKAVGEGTGLGLSVSYFIIVNQHRGNLSVESELHNGTKFIIELPQETVQTTVGLK